MIPLPQPYYLTKKQLMQLTGLSGATIERYKAKGLLSCEQPGGKGCRVLYPPDAIERASGAAANGQAVIDAAMGQSSAEPSPDAASNRAVEDKRRLDKPLPGPAPRWKTQIKEKTIAKKG